MIGSSPPLNPNHHNVLSIFFFKPSFHFCIFILLEIKTPLILYVDSFILLPKDICFENFQELNVWVLGNFKDR